MFIPSIIKQLVNSIIFVAGGLISYTWVSDRLRALASSILSGVLKYLCASNRFSNPFNCWSLNTVRAFLRRQCFPPGSPPLKRELNGRPENKMRCIVLFTFSMSHLASSHCHLDISGLSSVHTYVFPWVSNVTQFSHHNYSQWVMCRIISTHGLHNNI